MKRAPRVLLFLLAFIIVIPAVNAGPPTIDNVYSFPTYLEFEDNVTLRTEISREDVNQTIDKVMVNLTYEYNDTIYNESYLMENKTSLYEWGGRYDYVFQMNNDTMIYYFSIFANDTDGNYTWSSTYDFYVTTTSTDQVSVQIEVAPSCNVGFSDYYVPDEVVQEQKVLFFQINQNIGNMDVNETSKMQIVYQNGSTVWDYIDPYDPTEIATGDDDLSYGIWTTRNTTPLGYYDWYGITEYITTIFIGNVSYEWPGMTNSTNCTALNDTDTDGLNETTCWELIKRSSSTNFGRTHEFNTTSASSKNITGMNPNKTAYHGIANVTDTIYNAYTFWMNDCENYCYACMSLDTNISDDECSYRGESSGIKNERGNITITQLDQTGQNVTFRETFTSYTDRYTILECEINILGTLAQCNEYYQCNGSAKIVDEFEVVIQPGGQKELPSPQPPPETVPEPEPDPDPNPRPEPGPIQINIYPVKAEISGMQEQLTPVVFTVENVGGSTATNITLTAILGSGWETENANVDRIEPGEKLNRTLFVMPSYSVQPSVYVIPVQAMDENGDVLDMNYFWFEVLEGKFLAKIKILESPSEIDMESESTEKIPLLLKNIGKKPLTDIKAKLENIEETIMNFESGEIELDIDEEGDLDINVETKVGPKTSNSMIIVETDENAYAFSRIKINLNPPPALLPGGLPLIPVLATISLIIMMLSIILRMRGRYMGFFYPLVTIATFLLLVYISLWYFGFVPMF